MRGRWERLIAFRFLLRRDYPVHFNLVMLFIINSIITIERLYWPDEVFGEKTKLSTGPHVKGGGGVYVPLRFLVHTTFYCSIITFYCIFVWIYFLGREYPLSYGPLIPPKFTFEWKHKKTGSAKSRDYYVTCDGNFSRISSKIRTWYYKV